jgi:hypothetical protein
MRAKPFLCGRPYGLAALHQGVANFLEKLHSRDGGGGSLCGSSSCLRAKLVHGLDRHEQDEGHDQEADHIVDEQPDVHGGGAGLPRRRERMLAGQRMKMLLKSTPPVMTPIGGMMMSSTSDLTIVEKAAPMMMPTADVAAQRKIP